MDRFSHIVDLERRDAAGSIRLDDSQDDVRIVDCAKVQRSFAGGSTAVAYILGDLTSLRWTARSVHAEVGVDYAMARRAEQMSGEMPLHLTTANVEGPNRSRHGQRAIGLSAAALLRPWSVDDASSAAT